MTSQTVAPSEKSVVEGKIDGPRPGPWPRRPGRHRARRSHWLGHFPGPRRGAARRRGARGLGDEHLGHRRRVVAPWSAHVRRVGCHDAGGWRHLRVHPRRVRAVSRVSVWVGAVHRDREWIGRDARGRCEGVSGCVGAADPGAGEGGTDLRDCGLRGRQRLGNAQERGSLRPGRPQPRWLRSS